MLVDVLFGHVALQVDMGEVAFVDRATSPSSLLLLGAVVMLFLYIYYRQAGRVSLRSTYSYTRARIEYIPLCV